MITEYIIHIHVARELVDTRDNKLEENCIALHIYVCVHVCERESEKERDKHICKELINGICISP